VLAGTFAALTQIPQVAITEVGTAVALGVLLDTLVVRTVLVPACLLALGDRAWWPSRPRGRHRGTRRVKSRVTGHRTSFPSLSR
jgi:putative drug exporter of the RND superfamily